MWNVAKKSIPRGCRKQYIPGFTDTSKDIYNQYIKAYDTDPFAEETIELGEMLLRSLREARKELCGVND